MSNRYCDRVEFGHFGGGGGGVSDDPPDPPPLPPGYGPVLQTQHVISPVDTSPSLL